MVNGKFPKISIVTPNYNLASFLEKTIVSIIGQNYPNLQYIIVDGGSTDESAQIINKYKKYFSEIIIEKDDGHADALSKGFACADGDIMGWVNSDDILLPGALNLVSAIFRDFPYVNWIQGNQSIINEDGVVIKSNESRSMSRVRCLLGDYQWIQQESTFWTSSLWNIAGKQFDKKIKLAVDFELWMRFFRYTNLYNIQGAIGAFRVREGQRSASQSAEYEKEVIEIINREKSLLTDGYKKFYGGIFDNDTKTIVSSTRNKLPNKASTEDLQSLKFDFGKSRYFDSNKSNTRKILNYTRLIKSNTFRGKSDWVIRQLEDLRDKHKGERLFVMGNGPSLNKMDLSLFKDEIVFGCNSCFLLFDRIEWRPKYYTCVDTRVLPDRASEIRDMATGHSEMTLFFPEILRTYDGSGKTKKSVELIGDLGNVFYFRDKPPLDDSPYSAFSLNLFNGLIIPNTVTVTMLQLGAFLGFDEIYLIGCDTSYVVPKTVKQDGPGLSDQEKLFLTSTKDDDLNHFDPRYFGKGRAWHNPKVEDMLEHYKKSKVVLDHLGVKVMNATVGGNLEVFPRIDYRKVLGK